MSVVISNSVNQYLISESFKNLNKNMIDSTLMRKSAALGSEFLKKNEKTLK